MKYLWIYLVIAAVLYGGYYYYKKQQSPTGNTTYTMTPSRAPAASPAMNSGAEVKTFNLTEANFRFDPSTITVKQGDTVRLVLNDVDLPHNLNIDELNVHSDNMTAGQSTSVEFVADKVGKFEYYCSVDSHREKGMVGTLVVTQ